MPRKKKLIKGFYESVADTDLDCGYKLRYSKYPDDRGKPSGGVAQLVAPDGTEVETIFGQGVVEDDLWMAEEWNLAARLHKDLKPPYDRPPHRGVGSIYDALDRIETENYTTAVNSPEEE